jgi:hypothetical protein
MHVPEIIQVKETFDIMSNEGFVVQWELPYENLLTRRSAAIFFFSATNKEETLNHIKGVLSEFENFSMRSNVEMTLSKLDFRVTFSKEDKEKNEAIALNDVPVK